VRVAVLPIKTAKALFLNRGSSVPHNNGQEQGFWRRRKRRRRSRRRRGGRRRWREGGVDFKSGKCPYRRP